MIRRAQREQQRVVQLASAGADENFRRLRRRVHSALIDSLEQDQTRHLNSDQHWQQLLEDVIEEMDVSAELDAAVRKRLDHEILEEIQGFGPLAPLMIDSGITDILINGPDNIWVDRGGVMQQSEVRFDDEEHLRRLLDRMVSSVGRQLDTRTPAVDVRLPDGSRLNAVIPPLSRNGAIVSIRRFSSTPLTADELVRNNFCSRDLMNDLLKRVQSRGNIIITGGVGSGKTTLLGSLASAISPRERVVTIEDTAELDIEHPHVVALESRNGNSDGFGAINPGDLVRTALRMRANRLLVGEVRGPEVLDMLQAMNTGHDGSLCTLHANNPGSVVSRLEILALSCSNPPGLPMLHRMILAANPTLVHVERQGDGQRRLAAIAELTASGKSLSARTLWSAGSDIRAGTAVSTFPGNQTA